MNVNVLLYFGLHTCEYRLKDFSMFSLLRVPLSIIGCKRLAICWLRAAVKVNGFQYAGYARSLAVNVGRTFDSRPVLGASSVDCSVAATPSATDSPWRAL